MAKKIIEVLFGEICGLNGDLYNIEYLKQIDDNIEVIKTSLFQKPAFLDKHVDLVYMGSLKESHYQYAINALKDYKEDIQIALEKGQLFLANGNSYEIFGQYIDDIKALGIFDYHAFTDFKLHHHSAVVAKFNDIEIYSFICTFSYVENIKEHFVDVIKGYGDYDDRSHEGIHYKNFIGTHIQGPLLVHNGEFTKYILKMMGIDKPLKYESTVNSVYQLRKEMFYKKNIEDGVYWPTRGGK